MTDYSKDIDDFYLKLKEAKSLNEIIGLLELFKGYLIINFDKEKNPSMLSKMGNMFGGKK